MDVCSAVLFDDSTAQACLALADSELAECRRRVCQRVEHCYYDHEGACIDVCGAKGSDEQQCSTLAKQGIPAADTTPPGSALVPPRACAWTAVVAPASATTTFSRPRTPRFGEARRAEGQRPT